MFSSKTQLKKRTPENGTDRENFLSLLVDEYLNSTSFDAKCQVLANLANFAYDPINYEYIRDVGVLDIFIYVLKNESNLKLIHFATAGICNLCIDPLNAEYIVRQEGLQPILGLLASQDLDVVVDTITTLFYLCTQQSKPDININEITQAMLKLKESKDKRVANLAAIFLQDVCGNN